MARISSGDDSPLIAPPLVLRFYLLHLLYRRLMIEKVSMLRPGVDRYKEPRECAIVVPIRSFTYAKTRVDPNPSDLKASMISQSAGAVIEAARAYPTFVLTKDNVVTTWAHERGTKVITELGRGLNAELNYAGNFLQNHGFTRMVIALADVPLVSSFDIEQAASAPDFWIVSDRSQNGTNLLGLELPIKIALSFGPQSFASHRSEISRTKGEVEVITSSYACYDLDTPADIEALVAVLNSDNDGLSPVTLASLGVLLASATSLTSNDGLKGNQIGTKGEI